LPIVEVISPRSEGVSPPFLSLFVHMFDAGDVGDIFRFTVIQVEFLDFIENFLRPVAFLIVFHRYVGKRAKPYIASDIWLVPMP
jgi:hypothetical protein